MAAKMTMLARPYAVSAFEYAAEKNALSKWYKILCEASYLVKNEKLQALLYRPGIAMHTILERFFFDILKNDLTPEAKNFLKILAEYKRLPLLPDIAALFNDFYEAHQKMETVKVISATTLTDHYQALLKKSLSKRLNRDVSLECETDPALLGGAIIRAGDLVIDGSLRSKLNRLLESL